MNARVPRRDKPLPPFGRILEETLRRGLSPRNDLRLYVGHRAISRAKSDMERTSWVSLALPESDSPSSYRWPVAGCEVLIIPGGNFEGETLQRLARALLQDGAVVVRAIHIPSDKLSVFRPGSKP